MSGRRCESCGKPLRGKQRQFCGHRCNGRAQANRKAGKIREALAGGVDTMAAFLRALLAEAEREAAGLPGRRGRPPLKKAAA